MGFADADATAAIEGPSIDRPIRSPSLILVSHEVEVMDENDAPATEEMAKDPSLPMEDVVLGNEVNDANKSPSPLCKEKYPQVELSEPSTDPLDLTTFHEI